MHHPKLVPVTIAVGGIITISTLVHSDTASFVFIVIGIAVALGVFWNLRRLSLNSKKGQADSLKLQGKSRQ